MSLNFDLTAVKKRLGEERYNHVTTSPETRDKPDGEQKWHPITDALIWASMVCDLGEITEKNVDEWYFRIRMLTLVSNSGGIGKLVGGIGEFWITREDIQNHIGLTTNVSDKTRSAWLNRQFGKDREGLLPPLPQKKSALDAIDEAMAAYKAEQKDA